MGRLPQKRDIYRLNLKLDKKLDNGLKQLAKINGCSRTTVVQQLIWAEIGRVGVNVNAAPSAANGEEDEE